MLTKKRQHIGVDTQRNLLLRPWPKDCVLEEIRAEFGHFRKIDVGVFHGINPLPPARRARKMCENICGIPPSANRKRVRIFLINVRSAQFGEGAMLMREVFAIFEIHAFALRAMDV
jgi:hypothetical protein